MDIQVVSLAATEQGEIPLDRLPQEARETLAVRLKEVWLNELFRGLGRVTPETEKK